MFSGIKKFLGLKGGEPTQAEGKKTKRTELSFSDIRDLDQLLIHQKRAQRGHTDALPIFEGSKSLAELTALLKDPQTRQLVETHLTGQQQETKNRHRDLLAQQADDQKKEELRRTLADQETSQLDKLIEVFLYLKSLHSGDGTQRIFPTNLSQKEIKQMEEELKKPLVASLVRDEIKRRNNL